MSDGPVKPPCPSCGAGLYQHSKSIWCVHCGWAKNKPTGPSPVAQLLEALVSDLRRLL